MSDLCYMSGYGIELDDLIPLLNKNTLNELEKYENDIFKTFELLTEKSEYISSFSSDDGQFLYIPDSSPYNSLFSGIDHINEYFFNALKSYLKEEITVKDLDESLDDVFSYDFY